MTLEEFKTLKPGDKVTLTSGVISNMDYGDPDMDKYRGRIMTVQEIKTNECSKLMFARLKEDSEGWDWYPWMIAKKVPDTITMEIPEDNGKIYTETEVKIMLLEREFAEFREQIKDELARLKSRLFDYMDKK